MCIIVYNPAGQELDKGLMRTAYDNNPHGFGIMWIEDHEVHSLKGMSNFKNIWSFLNQLHGCSYALHFRWKTVGSINDDQCHPHEVLTRDSHGFNLFMMHNGTIFNLPKHKNKSDSQVYAKHLRSTYLNKHRNLGNFFHSVQGTKETIGTFNKFVFMADGNRVEIVNEESGVWLDNTWYSNVYSFEEGYRKKAKVQRKTFRG